MVGPVVAVASDVGVAAGGSTTNGWVEPALDVVSDPLPQPARTRPMPRTAATAAAVTLYLTRGWWEFATSVGHLVESDAVGRPTGRHDRPGGCPARVPLSIAHRDASRQLGRP
jgi:hypothetical protein